MATDSKCARAVEAPGGRPRGSGVGSSPLSDACVYARLAGPAAGVSPHPREGPCPSLPITLCSQAGLERRRWSWQPVREGCGRRASAGRRDGGTLRCHGAAGPVITALRGQCPQAHSQPFGSPATKAPPVFGAVSSRFVLSSGLDLRACLFGIRVPGLPGCSVAPHEPYSQGAAEGWPETPSGQSGQ